MGDRYISYKICPNCGNEYEIYDAPSSLMYSAHCEHCGFDEDMDYVEIGNCICHVPGVVKRYIMDLEKQVEDLTSGKYS